MLVFCFESLVALLVFCFQVGARSPGAPRISNLKLAWPALDLASWPALEPTLILVLRPLLIPAACAPLKAHTWLGVRHELRVLIEAYRRVIVIDAEWLQSPWSRTGGIKRESPSHHLLVTRPESRLPHDCWWRWWGGGLRADRFERRLACVIPERVPGHPRDKRVRVRA